MSVLEFKELVRTHRSVAYRMAYQLTGGRDAEANDLVQEVFLRIWRGWDFHRPYSVRGWIYRVIRNLHLDAVRRRTRYPAVSLEASNGHDLRWEDALADTHASLDNAL